MIGCRREKAVISQACDSDDDGHGDIDGCSEDARTMSHLRICRSLTGKGPIMSGTRLIWADEVTIQKSNYYS